MGRPKEFEPTIVLDRAMELFWQQGYEATSVEELVQAMGIQRGSLYATFGSKHELFLAVLDRYREQSIARTERIFAETGSPLAAIERALHQIADQASEQKRRWGCLMTNATVELALHDREILTQSQAHRARVQLAFAAAVAAGQRCGEIRTDESSASLANYLYAVIQGLRVVSKNMQEQSELDDIVRIAVRSLRAPD